MLTVPSSLLTVGSVAEVCGVRDEARWLCVVTFRATENEALARTAGALTTAATVLLILVATFLITRLTRRIVLRSARRMERRIEDRLTKAEQRGAISAAHRYRTRRLQRLQAVTGVSRGVINATIWLIALFVILSELNVRLQPIFAGAGLLGIVVGFGAQQLVRDVLAGIAMLIEDQYGVGDWIEVDGVYGSVERVGLRSTAFRDIDGVVHHVLNGSIQRVGNLSQHWARATFDVPLALDSDIPAAKALIHRVATDLANDPVWGSDIIGPPEIWGVQEFGPEGIKIRLVIPTKPLRNWDIARQLRERMKAAFDRAHIRMPSALVDLGGQQTGYPLITQETERHPPTHAGHGLVPPDVGPFDRPPSDRRGAPPGAAAAPPTADDSRDHTDALRIERGPEPRPD